METLEILKDYETRYWNEAKTVLLKQWKGRIKTAKQNIWKSKKILDWKWTLRGYKIVKPDNQWIIDLYNERIQEWERIIKLWETKISELENIN